eukprot:SAG31_NODE_331_length_17518_cov_32.495042_10_plen_257_part_00
MQREANAELWLVMGRAPSRLRLSVLLARCRWLDDCCRPIEQSLQSMMWARAGHVERAIFELETNKPDVATDLLASASRATTYEINEEGAVIGRGMIRWLPRSGTVFTDAYKGNTFCAQTAVGMICSLCDSLSCMQAPYCAEIPRAILEIVGAEPDDTIAVSYRRYMNTVCGPEVQRVAQILQDFSPTMQWCEWRSHLGLHDPQFVSHHFALPHPPRVLSCCFLLQAANGVASREVPRRVLAFSPCEHVLQPVVILC